MYRDEFVDVREVAPEIEVELRYAGTRHAFARAMYPLNRAFLRRECALKLAAANELLRPTGLRLKVWDAYRPLSVQAAMWDQFPDPEFIAPPTRGSKHNRGVAVDVTLVDHLGAEVEMPTDFDDFSPAARSDADCSARSATHRELLREAMLAAGFAGIESEWWHFADPGWEQYPLCDVSLHKLAAKADAKRRG